MAAGCPHKSHPDSSSQAVSTGRRGRRLGSVGTALTLLHMASASLLAGAARGLSSCRKTPSNHSAAGSAGVQQYWICTALSSSGYWQAGRCVSSGTVWGAREASGVLFRMRGAVSGVPGKTPQGHLGYWIRRRAHRRKLKNAAGTARPPGPPGDQACRHGAWLQLNAATGLRQNVGGHGTRLPGWGGCVSGPRFPLPGSRHTDRHNHVPNAESGTSEQAGERGERQVSGGVEGRRHPQSEAVPVSFRDQTPTRGLQQCDRDYMLPVAPTPDHRPHHGPRPFPRQGRRPGLRRRLCPDLRPRPHRALC